MDALSDVLRVAQLTGGVFLDAEFSAPWCLATRVSRETCAPFLQSSSQIIPYHYIVAGELRLRIEGGDAPDLLLQAGDIVVLPRNDLHRMGSDLDLPPMAGADIIQPSESGGLYTIRHGGGGAQTRMVCGFLGYGGAENNPVVAALPPLLKLKLDEAGAAEWIGSTFRYAAAEIAAGRPGSETVLAKLAELLFVETVRRYAETLPEGHTGWLAGLRDQHVARALALIHREVARAWTVDELGRAVGLSRSALAERFTRLIGMPPMHYVANWRMQVAAQKLLNTSASLAQIAEIVGYESEAAFSRAFKKSCGTAPATWRRSRG